MPRFPAYFAMVALLAAPLALVARGISCNPSECDCLALCARQAAAQGMRLCGAARHAPMCGTHRGNHSLDYGFIAPLVPAAPLPRVQLAPPTGAIEFLPAYTQSAVPGFVSAPFEPPRS